MAGMAEAGERAPDDVGRRHVNDPRLGPLRAHWPVGAAGVAWLPQEHDGDPLELPLGIAAIPGDPDIFAG